MQNAKSMSFGKMAVAFLAAVVMAVTLSGVFASQAHASTVVKGGEPYEVTYGKSISKYFDFKINNYAPEANGDPLKVTISSIKYSKGSSTRNVTAKVKTQPVLRSVNDDGTATYRVTLTYTGVNANYGSNNVTTVKPVVKIGDRTFEGKLLIKVKCNRADTVVTPVTKSIKHSTIKKGAVKWTGFKTNRTSGNANTFSSIKKVSGATYVKTTSSTSKTIQMTKHKCAASTKSHTTKFRIKMKASKNYNAYDKTVSVKVKMV